MGFRYKTVNRFHFSPTDGGACWQGADVYCGDITIYRGCEAGAVAHADGGSVRVQALDRDGTLLAESEPITANVTDGRVRWQRGVITTLKGKAVRFRFELSDARYGVRANNSA